MAHRLDDSEVAIFRSFVAKLMSLQKQLDELCRGYHYLQDRLFTAEDIPEIRDSLLDRIPRSSQWLIDLIANRPSSQPISGSSVIENRTDRQSHQDTVTTTATGDQATEMYSLVQNYRGEAKLNMTTFLTGRPGRQKRGRRICPLWMCGEKGCFVCGRRHRANEKHYLYKVTAAARKLKEKKPTALLTVEDLALLANLCASTNYKRKDDYVADWAKDNYDIDKDNEISTYKIRTWVPSRKTYVTQLLLK